jgi:hypothetical protein
MDDQTARGDVVEPSSKMATRPWMAWGHRAGRLPDDLDQVDLGDDPRAIPRSPGGR